MVIISASLILPFLLRVLGVFGEGFESESAFSGIKDKTIEKRKRKKDKCKATCVVLITFASSSFKVSA
jgi:hypothetical protein